MKDEIAMTDRLIEWTDLEKEGISLRMHPGDQTRDLIWDGENRALLLPPALAIWYTIRVLLRCANAQKSGENAELS